MDVGEESEGHCPYGWIEDNQTALISEWSLSPYNESWYYHIFIDLQATTF